VGSAVSVLLILFSTPTSAISLYEDFLAGIEASVWEVDSNQPLYTVDDSQGDIRLAKPVGGDYSFQRIHIRFRGEVHGDFDASVDFSDAFVDLVDGRPGNQVQLNVDIGVVEFDVVHSDEIGVGRNNHVWISPPGEWRGEQATSETSGTLRITRTGIIVSGYFNDTLIHTETFPARSPVTFLSFSLQNNGTTDSTSVTFDNFQLTADSLVFETAAGAGGSGDVPQPATILVSPNPFVHSTSLQYTLHKPGTVRASIYDATGRRVAPLVEGYHAEGFYTVPWDGRSATGARAPSGVYFLRFQFEGVASTRKVVLIR
jgi:hypothetical protein